MRPTIKNKLIAGFSCLLLLMSAVTGIGTYALFSLKRSAHEATGVGDRLDSIAIEIQVHNLEAQRLVRSYLGDLGKLGPEKARETYLDEAGFEIHEMESLTAKATAIAPSAEKRATFNKIAQNLTIYSSALDETIKAAESGAGTERRNELEAAYQRAAENLHQSAEDGEVAGNDASQSSQEAIERTSGRATRLDVGFALFGLLSGIVMSIGILRTILRPVNHLKDVAESVSMGNLKIQVKRYSDDEMGDLSDSFSRMLTAVRYFQMEAEMVQSEGHGGNGGAL